MCKQYKCVPILQCGQEWIICWGGEAGVRPAGRVVPLLVAAQKMEGPLQGAVVLGEGHPEQALGTVPEQRGSERYPQQGRIDRGVE